jgi:hypothetical protein
MIGVGVLLLAAGASSVAALSSRTTGIVTAVGERSVQVATKSEGVVSVGIDEKTAYHPWTMHKPWQASGVSSRSLVAGRCVSIEQRANGNGVAGIVWINDDGAGTIWDPCRSFR